MSTIMIFKIFNIYNILSTDILKIIYKTQRFSIQWLRFLRQSNLKELIYK